MALNLREPVLALAILTLDPEGVDDLPDDPRGAPDANVLVAHRTVLVQNEPVLYASLAEQLIAVVALLGIPCHLYSR